MGAGAGYIQFHVQHFRTLTAYSASGGAAVIYEQKSRRIELALYVFMFHPMMGLVSNPTSPCILSLNI